MECRLRHVVRVGHWDGFKRRLHGHKARQMGLGWIFVNYMFGGGGPEEVRVSSFPGLSGSGCPHLRLVLQQAQQRF